jgi:hypothetical protein
MTKKTQPIQESPRPRNKRISEPMRDYVAHIEHWLSRMSVSKLQELCRVHSTNIDDLAIAIAAREEHMEQWRVKQKIEEEKP